MKADGPRAAAMAVVVVMSAGLAYSGIASARAYLQLIGRPAAGGPSASIDEQMAPLKVSSEAVREAVRQAGWPPDADVTLVVNAPCDAAGLNSTRLRYAFGYLLFPMRIWLKSAPRDTRRAIVIGSAGDLVHRRLHRVSDMMLLVDVQ